MSWGFQLVIFSIDKSLNVPLGSVASTKAHSQMPIIRILIEHIFPVRIQGSTPIPMFVVYLISYSTIMYPISLDKMLIYQK